MEVEILKEKEVSLLERKRVNAMVTFDGGATPSILEFKAVLAKQLNVDPKLIAIRHVYQKYGFTKAKVIAHIYKNRKALLHLEKLKKAERKAEESKKKEAEEKAKAAKEKVVEEKPKAAEEKVVEEKPKESSNGKEASKE